jgi:hypothetical protein
MEMSSQLYATATFSPWDSIHWIEDWVDTGAALDMESKMKILAPAVGRNRLSIPYSSILLITLSRVIERVNILTFNTRKVNDKKIDIDYKEVKKFNRQRKRKSGSHNVTTDTRCRTA